ncbi:hypothetical protein ACHAW6_013489 [Cyclotella cf. meneghiniana]
MATNVIGNTTEKLVIPEKKGTKQEQPETMQWKDGKPAGEFNNTLKLDSHLQCHVVHSFTTTPGCTNPQNLNTTALLDTGANISFLQVGAPANCTKLQTAPKRITQPKGSLVTTENLLLLLNKLPVLARNAHQARGISNNLLVPSELTDTGCELFFHKTGHRTNTAKRVIRMWKNHFVSIRAGTP